MEKNKAFMAAIPFPSPSSCLQLALFQCCYLASSLKPTNLLPKISNSPCFYLPQQAITSSIVPPSALLQPPAWPAMLPAMSMQPVSCLEKGSPLV